MRTASAEIVWHDLECGRYSADLPLWRQLADSRPGPVLDVGAGAGRVSIALAKEGHDVTALDRDEELLSELSRRAQRAGTAVSTVIADARDFQLEERFGLILVPMQMLQLLDSEGRARFLARARDQLAAGGRLSAAITERFDLYDGRGRDAAGLPSADVTERAGTVFVSQPTAVRRVAGGFLLERRRERLSPDGARLVELNRERLHRLSAKQLESEAVAVGLRPSGRTRIQATDDHVGSVVVMLDG